MNPQTTPDKTYKLHVIKAENLPGYEVWATVNRAYVHIGYALSEDRGHRMSARWLIRQVSCKASAAVGQ